MFCALLGQDIRRAFTGPLVLWFFVVAIFDLVQDVEAIHDL